MTSPIQLLCCTGKYETLYTKKKKYYCTEKFYLRQLTDIQGEQIPGLMLRGKTLHSFVALNIPVQKLLH